MSGRKVGIGIVGTGFLAETRARCYRAVAGVEAEIVAVASRTRAAADAWARRHGVATACDDLASLLALDAVHLVDLCVPNHLHRPFAEAAAAAGKHVVCTKPLTAYVGQDLDASATDREISGRDPELMSEVALADADAMVEACRRHGVWLAYGENWIYAPAIARARQLLARSGGVVLEMRGGESHSGSHSPYSKRWRNTGGGALLRLGAHAIGAMLHLKQGAGVRPVAVSAEVADLSRHAGLDPENTRIATGWQDVETWGCALISFDDGSRPIAHGSDNLLGGMESRLDILASNCRLVCNLSPNDQLRAYAPDGGVFGDAYIMEKVESGAGWSTPIPSEDRSSGHEAMCQDFVSAVVENRPPSADGALGREVVRVLYAAYLSAARGQRVTLRA